MEAKTEDRPSRMYAVRVNGTTIQVVADEVKEDSSGHTIVFTQDGMLVGRFYQSEVVGWWIMRRRRREFNYTIAG